MAMQPHTRHNQRDNEEDTVDHTLASYSSRPHLPSLPHHRQGKQNLQLKTA